VPARPLLVALLLVPLLQGCAYSMVRGDRIREDAFDDVLDRTVAARDLAVPDSFETRVIPRSAIPELLRAAIVADWEAQAIADYQETLIAIGAWPPDRDLIDEYVSVGEEELAGVYVPKESTLYVIEDAPIPFSLRLLSTVARRDFMREIVLAHELVHLLQHGAYPELLEDDADWRDQDDAAAALSAAIEGDATRFGIVAVIGDEDALPSPESFRADIEAEQASDTGALARAPALLRLTLAFPYVSGYALSLNEGAALLDEPPASTEQAIHPAKRHEPFLAIDLAPAREALPRHCRWLGDNTLGELGISVLLRDLGDSPSPEIWEGWDGDRFMAARCGERRAFVWETHWDSDRDAAEFAEAYAGIANTIRGRIGLERAPEIRLNGRRVRIVSDPLREVSDSLDTLSHRGRVTRVSELRAHFGAPYRERETAARR
jgi:hypothetical protein